MTRREKCRLLAALFFQFMKFGCFTFGGGWGILAQMQKKYVEQSALITNEQLLDITSIGRSIPGAMICNVAMLFGYRIAGVVGGFVCVFGMIIPPFAVLSLISLSYDFLLSEFWLTAALHGIRAAVTPIIVGAVVKMCRGSFKYPPCIVVAVLSFVLYTFFNFSCVALIAIGAVCGIAVCEYYERKA